MYDASIYVGGPPTHRAKSNYVLSLVSLEMRCTKKTGHEDQSKTEYGEAMILSSSGIDYVLLTIHPCMNLS